MWGRIAAETTVAMLFSRGFWGVFLLLAAIGFLIRYPMVIVVLLLSALLVAGATMLANHMSSQRLPVNGGTVPVREFQCTRCGELGKLRVERRALTVPGGAVQWPFVVCRNCGHEEQVPGHVIG
jgi:hypothetical protein